MTVYVPTSWQDFPNLSTPITAARLNNLEAGVIAAYIQGTGTLVNADLAVGAAIGIAKLASYPSDATKFLRGDGTWAAPAASAGSELGYGQRTSNVTAAGTSSATATDLSITTGAVTYDGTAAFIHFFTERVDPGTSFIKIVLYDGNTELGVMADIFLIANVTVSISAFYRLTPSAGSHTYNARAYSDGGTGVVHAGTGAISSFMPAFIRVTKA